MRVVLQKSFIKSYLKLPPEIKIKFGERRDLFLQNPNHQILRNHPVDKVYPGCRSINITGDYRAIFIEQGNVITFLYIGTHSQLYG